MTKVVAKGYASPSLVLLAMDWPNVNSHHDFLRIAIRRTPGFLDNKEEFISNVILKASLYNMFPAMM